MQNQAISGLFYACFILLLFTFSACDDDDITDGPDDNNVTVSITDAPLDDPNVSAVFVTVAAVSIDGEELEGVSRTTFELSALQNGDSRVLGEGNVTAGSYNEITLRLDDENDATNSGPGCYVVDADGEKLPLSLEGDGSIRITNTETFTASSDATTNLVIDFDLRKALRRGEETNDYNFSQGNRLNASLRAVVAENTGSIEGDVDRNSVTDGTVVVYAYQSGTYADSEMSGNADAQFLNAVSSTRVKADGSFNLAFLPAGSYEVILVAYADEDDDGRQEMEGRLNVSVLGNLGLDLGAISVQSRTETTLDLRLSGIF